MASLLRPPLCLFILFLLSAVPSYGQVVGGSWDTRFQWDGVAVWDKLGASVSDAGDVNNDGFSDVIVGAPYSDSGGFFDTGSAYVYSGADGSLLHQWDGLALYDRLGSSVSGAGDVNNDGFSDLIVGAPNASPSGLSSAGSVFVYSGADGSLLYQWDGAAADDTLGVSVSDAGDVNNDGFMDLIVGASNASPSGLSSAGSVFVYSGADGSLLYQWDGTNTYAYLGNSVSDAGDVNNDGFGDLIAGAKGTVPTGLPFAGSAFVYSGADGSLLYRWDGTAALDNLGISVSSAGDVNNDGFSDLIVGAYGADPGGLNGAGSAYVYSGSDGSLLYQMDGTAALDSLGTSVSDAGDVNNDGFGDLIVGTRYASPGGLFNAGSAYVYSGSDGSMLKQWNGTSAYFSLGSSVSGAGDVNNDGFSDLIVGAPGFGASGGLSSAYVFGLDPFLTATSNSVSASSTSLIGLELNFPPEAADYSYKVLFSATGTGPFTFGVDIPLTLDFRVIHSYYGDYSIPFQSDLQGTLTSSSKAFATFGAPASYFAGSVGRVFYGAAIASPPGGAPAYSSVAVAFEILP